MHKIYSLLTGILLLISNLTIALPDTNSDHAGLNGKVTDKATGEPLPGVTVYLPDLKTGAQTNVDGNFNISHLPATKVMVQISFIGYKTLSQEVDLSVIKSQNFKLEKSVTEINEVVVTGQSSGVEQKRTPAPIEMVPHTQMLQNSSTNIIDALAHVPGVSQVTTGAGISKPVIRGLGYNRVVVINDGIRQEGQQWGDEHGIEIDQYGVNHVEILKGPASLAYGSDAMAGVINMLSAPTLPEGSIKGNVISNYQTNNGLVGYSADFSGNKNGVIWDARYSNKLAHAYQNKYDGPVYNSGFREHAASAMVGINRSWGFSHLHLSLYHLQPGMSEGERDSLTGKFTKTLPDGSEALATSSDFNSYHPAAPFQKIDHYKAVWNSSFFFGQSNLKTTFGFQQNNRKEFEEPHAYGLYFLLNTLNYDGKYLFPEVNGWKFTTGINGMWQQSQNKGSEFLVPAYHLFDYGVFAIVRKKAGQFDFSGGLRYDHRSETGTALYQNDAGAVVQASDPNSTKRFSAFEKNISGISGSIGGTYQISESAYTKLNISKGFRAPNIAELGSNGVHEGTFRYEIGNPALTPEESRQIDWAIGMDTKHVSTELDLFDNQVNHYIFSHKLNSIAGNDSLMENVPVFQFTDGKAHLWGGEFRLDIHPHPLDWLHFENTFSYVNSTLENQPDSSKYLPYTPPARWQSELKVEFHQINGFLANGYFKIGMEKYWAQNHYYAAFGTETATPEYTLFNMGAGVDLKKHQRTICSLYLSAENLTNVAYQSHLSRFKYMGYNYKTGRTGIFNMGRNFSFKLIIPIDFED
ncbi:MAG TPA: TonB-dependent receptor, partial [Sunxiuqinia sp.]|nr:TonB-dependent receptor [Sunxiuqinia sp.]